MLLPYAHDQMRARRWPVVTIGIVAINVLVFVLCLVQDRAIEPELAESAERIATIWTAHRSLVLPARFAATIGRELDEPSGMDNATITGESESLTPERRAELQRALDDEGARFDALLDRSPTIRWGYVPSHPRVVTAFTSMFLHGGVLHILGNMWFLWLAAVSLEDRWGRGAFLAFYVLGGVFATYVHGVTTSAVDVPLIGASGAIAATMGAFLVLFSKAHIQFVYWIMVRPGRFAAPAYVMLPLWFVEQLGYAVLFPTDAGVAFGAHVAGFCFGVAAAVGLKYSGVDARLDRAVDASVTVGIDERMEGAEDAMRTGRIDEARTVARAVLADAERKGAAGSADILAALRVLYSVDGDQQMFERFVRLAATDDFSLDEAARATSARMHTHGDDAIARLPLALRARLAKRLESLGDTDAASRVRPPPSAA